MNNKVPPLVRTLMDTFYRNIIEGMSSYKLQDSEVILAVITASMSEFNCFKNLAISGKLVARGSIIC